MCGYVVKSYIYLIKLNMPMLSCCIYIRYILCCSFHDVENVSSYTLYCFSCLMDIHDISVLCEKLAKVKNVQVQVSTSLQFIS